MRSNGVINYPDPNSSGVIPKESSQQLGVTNAKFQSATNFVQALTPERRRRAEPGPDTVRESVIAEVRSVHAQPRCRTP